MRGHVGHGRGQRVANVALRAILARVVYNSMVVHVFAIGMRLSSLSIF